MKTPSHLTNSMLSAPARVRFALGLSVAAAGTLVASSAQAATITKANNNTALGTTTSWVGGVLPGTTDTLLFDSTVTFTPNAVSATNGVFYGGLQITNTNGGGPTNLVTIGIASNGTWTFNNNAMIDMSSVGGSNLTLTGGTMRVASANFSPAITVASGRTLTFQGTNGVMSNQGNTKTLSLSGAGTINFNNTAVNNFAGGAMNVSIAGPTVTILGASSATATNMSSGSLFVGANSSLGAGTSNLSGGTLGFAVGGLTIANTLNVTNTVTLGQSGAFAGTFSGILTGNGTLQNANTGTAINNDISFTGNLSGFTGTINYTNSATNTTNWWRVGATDGTANLALANVVLNAGTGDAKNFGFSNGISRATLKIGELSGAGLFQGSYLGGTTLADSNILEVGAKNTSSTYSGVIGIANSFMDNIALIKVGATGTLILTANSPFYGGTTISAGTLQVGNATTTGNLGTGAVLNNAALTFNRTDTFTFGNAISGTGSVSMNGSGTLALTSANGFFGALTINGSGGAGAVRLDNANAAQNVSGVAVNVNNGLTFGTGITAVTIAALSGTGNVALTNTDTNGVALSLGSTGSTYSGVLSGAGSLSKVGAGTTILAIGGQSYAGATNLSGGTLQASSSGNTASNLIGAGALNLSLGGRFRFNSTTASTLNNALDVGTGGGTVSIRGGTTFSPTALTGSGALALDIDNTVTLTPTTFNGWNGTVNVSTSGAGAFFRLGGTFDNASLLNAKLDLGAGISATRNAGTNGTVTTDIGTLSGAAGSFIGGSLAGSGTFTFSTGSRNENATFAGNVVDGSTKTALTKVGSGIQTLSGTNNYTGLTTISAGTLEVSGGAAIANAGAVSIASVAGARLLVSASETIGSLNGGSGANGEVALGSNSLTVGDASTMTFGGTISGAGGTLVKQGAGTLNLAVGSVQTYGTLSATDGTTNVNSALGSGSSAVTVAGVTTLKFGSVSQKLGSLSIGAGSTVRFTSGLAAFSGDGKAPSLGGGAVVPEPGTLGLLLVGAVGVLNRRRRQS